MNNKKGSILMVSLWVLTIFTVFGLSLGHRTAIDLKLATYQRDRLNAYYLAKAGLNRVIAVFLETEGYIFSIKDKPSIDNEELFTKIVDEERKFNINATSKELLLIFLSSKGIGQEAPDLVGLICKYRDPDEKESEEEKRVFKNAPLRVPEELITIFEYFYKKNSYEDYRNKAYQLFDKIKDDVTVWGNKKININTASRPVLEALIQYSAGLAPGGENDPQGLLDIILDVRPVTSLAELRDKLNEKGDLSTGQANVLNELLRFIDSKSSCFYVISNAKIKNSGIISRVRCVFRRDDKQILYWHES